MRIGELARRTAVSERSLRYYEKLGLLSAERTPGGHRDFPETAVDRVICIQQLFAAGLCSSKIGQLLPCLPGATPGAKPSPSLVAELLAERARIDRMMRDLAHSREVLDEVIGETREVIVGSAGGEPIGPADGASIPEPGRGASAPEPGPGAD